MHNAFLVVVRRLACIFVLVPLTFGICMDSRLFILLSSNRHSTELVQKLPYPTP
jgi:hypothetical protein